MVKNNIYLSIITLSKNDNKSFSRTLKSIKSQKITFYIELIIVDGSNYKNQDKKANLLKRYLTKDIKNNIFINHVNSEKKKINGIYSCMNYGKSISRGKFIIFLNSGDIFFNNSSLQLLYDVSLDTDQDQSLIFGQANIIASKKLNWLFPGKRLNNIKRWLRFFEPNHQSMMISSKLAKNCNFNLDFSLISDGYWKREIIKKAKNIIYIKKPVVKFFLDGVSTVKPSKKLILDIIQNKNISISRKFIFVVKYLFPQNLFFIYHLMQKYKSMIIDIVL